MAQTVVLLHELPDGSSHYDWLIDQPEIDAEHRLLSFRCDRRPDLADGPIMAERLAEHRVRYLRYEGQLSNNRGRVSRVSSGAVQKIAQGPGSIKLDVQWADRLASYRLDRAAETKAGWRIMPQ